MDSSPELLANEFLKLVNYLAKNSCGIDSAQGSPSKSPSLDGYDSTISVSNAKALSKKLEHDLVSLLDQFDISEKSTVRLGTILREYEAYFSKNRRIPFRYVVSLMKGIECSRAELKSILELIFLLRNNSLGVSNWTQRPQRHRQPQSNHHGPKHLPPKKPEALSLEKLASSELRELFHSPLPELPEPPTSVSPLRTMFDSSVESGVLDENLILLDMIYVLKGIEGKYFKRVGGNYFLNSNLKISRHLRNLTQRVISLAKMYHSIKNLNLGEELTMKSLFQAIVEELEDFSKFVDVLMLHFGEEFMSPLELYSLLHRPYRKVRLIYLITNSGKVSLEELNDATFRGYVMSRELFSRLLRKSLVPFFEVVFRWMYSGELYARSLDFFVSESQADFKFHPEKVYNFFPQKLARSIFEKGREIHYLKKLRRKSPPLTLKSFLDRVCRDENWSLNHSLESLKTLEAEFTNSEELVSVLLGEYELPEYWRAVCSHFTHFPGDSSGSFKPEYHMVEALEYQQRVFYPNFKFPYTLVFDGTYDFYRNIISLSCLFRASVARLNQVFQEYLWFNRATNGVFQLSPFFNKVNFYRSEMATFLSGIYPFQKAAFHLETLMEALPRSRDLQSLRTLNRTFLNNLSFWLTPDVSDLLKNVLEFSNSLYELFNSDMSQLQASLGALGPEEVVELIESDLVDHSTSWNVLSAAESFRANLTKFVEKNESARLFLDFNHFYKSSQVPLNRL